MIAVSRPSFLKTSSSIYLLVFLLIATFVSSARAQVTSSGNFDFGTVNAGSSSSTQTLTFSFSTPTSLSTSTPVQVLTQGISGLDFKNDGSGSCAGSTYSTCTVGITFSPSVPGLRLGAVVLTDNTGTVVATAYVHGVGHGPQTGFDDGTQARISYGATDSNGLATDGVNLYIADAQTVPSIYKVTPSGTVSTVAQLTSGPDGVAVDGAGNIYVAMGIYSYILKITPAGVTTHVGTGLAFPGGLAVDGLGNLYITESGITSTDSGDVIKLTPDGTQSMVGSGLAQPAGVAIDAQGNVLIANTGGGTIAKVAPDGTQTTLVSGLSYPGGIAVDAAGNFYVALELSNQLVEYSPTGTQLRTFGNQLSEPSAVALDALGNIYVASGGTTLKISRTPPTIGFVTSSLNTTSSDSPRSFTLENIGNDTLTIPPVTGATNPTITTADFTLDSTTTCPVVTSSQLSATLNSGSSCLYAIDFAPTTTGTINSSLVLTDNSLNVANTTQTVPLNNQGTPVIIFATVTVNSVFTTYNGSPQPVTVTTDPAGLTVSVTYNGSATVPVAPGFYPVTATITQAGYSGFGSGFVFIQSPPAPVITWPTPAPITVGTPVSSTQLDATSTTPGTITYDMPLGTVLAVGSYSITATLTPSDTSGVTPTVTKTVTLVVQGNTQSVSPINFGNINAGSTSGSQTVTFTFINPVTLGGATPVQVLTQGAAGMDFKNIGTGSCAAGAYVANNSCTVVVSFTPAAPGPRLGSVVLEDASGNALATAFVGGIGMGPQVAYDPGVQNPFVPSIAASNVGIDNNGNLYLGTTSTIVKVAPGGAQTTVASGLSGYGEMAVDGAGNIYVADFFNSRVFEVAPSGATYQVGSGFRNPADIAIDATGNLYIVDTNYSQVFGASNGRVVKITPDGMQSVLAGPFVYPEGVAVDGAGNVYITDNAGLGTGNNTPQGLVYKITPSGSVSPLAAGLLSPYNIAVDAAGNVFVSRGSDNVSIDKIATNGVRTKFAAGLNFPGPMRVDSAGNLYTVITGTTSSAVKIDRSTVPSLSFASTNQGATSSDSPQAVNIENIGNATLNFPAPGAGTNASISSNFAFFAATTCPRSASTSTLASGSSCVYSVDFTPTTTGPITGTVSLTDNNLNAANSVQNISLSGMGASAGPTTATVILAGLSQTYTGSPLSVTATTVPAGLAVSLTYNGSATPPTAAGSYTVIGTVTTAGYTGSSTQTMVIAQATPVVSWATPAAITYGTNLSAMQLDATASVGGTFSYTPALGSTLAAGTDTLSVTFTPTDTNYTTVTQTVSLVVNQVVPVVSWANPASIPYGTTLSATQLNATASVPGSFTYTSAAGTTLGAGTDMLSVLFTPTDTTDYTTVNKSVSIVVTPVAPVITWANPASIPYGTALGGTQLNATASVPGTFTYTPAAGAVPAVGTDTLGVLFTPTDSTDYTTANKSVSIVVTISTPVITWSNPASISYGTALGGTQLNATASVPGTFTYTPAAGAVPAVGTDTLSVLFTPNDTMGYTTATKTVTITVTPAAPLITWANPAAIVYGAALSATQLNATASVPGTFTYTPAAGSTPTAGTQTLSVLFTPTDTTDYSAATKTVSLVVNQAMPVVTWATPAAINFGTALSATQLNATASVPGTFTYTPATGTIPAVGSDTLSVLFTPTDAVDYLAVTRTVTLTVNALPDFTFAPNGGQSQTIVHPGSATYTFAIAPTQGAYPGTVTFSATGLPGGYTSTFTPSSIATTGGAQTVIFTVQSPLTAMLTKPGNSYLPIATALLLLPLMGLGKLRRFRQKTYRYSLLLVMSLVGLATLAGVSGCGTGTGFYEQTGTNYTITVNATSASVSHSTTVQLVVK